MANATSNEANETFLAHDAEKSLDLLYNYFTNIAPISEYHEYESDDIEYIRKHNVIWNRGRYLAEYMNDDVKEAFVRECICDINQDVFSDNIDYSYIETETEETTGSFDWETASVVPSRCPKRRRSSTTFVDGFQPTLQHMRTS